MQNENTGVDTSIDLGHEDFAFVIYIRDPAIISTSRGGRSCWESLDGVAEGIAAAFSFSRLARK